MPDRRPFVDALLDAPVGVALLARVERWTRGDVHAWPWPPDSDPALVADAADAVRRWTFGQLVALAVETSYIDVGPWIPTAPEFAAAAYRFAAVRRPIAVAIDETFATELHAPFEPDAQEWWQSASGESAFMVRPRFRDFEDVYAAGQFTWAGLWTVTSPPGAAHADLAASWEVEPAPVTRWRMPVRAGARVREIHRPEDWVALIAEHPARGRPADSWELPGTNRQPAGLAALMAAAGQRAGRTTVRRHLVPDWRRVADVHDGVHLSWAGFLTTEGCIVDLGGGDVAMLRHWGSERTHWLADVFGDPEPLPPPASIPARSPAR